VRRAQLGGEVDDIVQDNLVGVHVDAGALESAQTWSQKAHETEFGAADPLPFLAAPDDLDVRRGVFADGVFQHPLSDVLRGFGTDYDFDHVFS